MIVIAAILAAVSFFGSSKLKTGLNAYELLKNYANQDVLVMQADAALTTNGNTSETSVDILHTSADGQSITRLTRDGLSRGRQRLRTRRERADRLWGTARCVRFPVRIG